MALVLEFDGRAPRLGRDVYLAETAVVVGDVELGDGASVWFGTIVRGDVGAIRIGARTNLQDLVCIHVTDGRPGGPEQADVVVGCDVTVGHGAVLHGCRVDDGCLIGMGSIVLDHAWLGAGTVVAAGTVVPPRMVVAPGSFVRGVPARVSAELTEAQARLGTDGAASYLEICRLYRTAAHRLDVAAGSQPVVGESSEPAARRRAEDAALARGRGR